MGKTYTKNDLMKIIENESLNGKTNFIERVMNNSSLKNEDVLELQEKAMLHLAKSGCTNSIMRLHYMGVDASNVAQKCIEESLYNDDICTADYLSRFYKSPSLLNDYYKVTDEASIGKTDYLENRIRSLTANRHETTILSQKASMVLSEYGYTDSLKRLHSLGISSFKIYKKCIDKALENRHIKTANYLNGYHNDNYKESYIQVRKTEHLSVSELKQESMMNHFKNLAYNKSKNEFPEYLQLMDKTLKHNEKNNEKQEKFQPSKAQKLDNKKLVVNIDETTEGSVIINGIRKDINDFKDKNGNIRIDNVDKISNSTFFCQQTRKPSFDEYIKNMEYEYDRKNTQINTGILINGGTFTNNVIISNNNIPSR